MKEKGKISPLPPKYIPIKLAKHAHFTRIATHFLNKRPKSRGGKFGARRGGGSRFSPADRSRGLLSRLSSAVQISVAWFCRPLRKIEPASSWYRLAFADRSGGRVACFNLVLLRMECLQYIPNLQDDFIIRSHTVELFAVAELFSAKKLRKTVDARFGHGF